MKKDLKQNVVGMILFFTLCAIGMLFSDRLPLLTFIGIVGLAGTAYFIFRIVTDAIGYQRE
jgi:cell division protein FtsW (lipid II flippase)